MVSIPPLGRREILKAVEQKMKKPLADTILFGALKGGGTAKGEGLGIVTKSR